MMVPDGSKEWWTTSNLANEVREYFVEQFSGGRLHADVFVGGWGELGTTGTSNREYDN